MSALSSVCAVVVSTHDRAARSDEPEVSLIGNESADAAARDRPAAHAPAAAPDAASSAPAAPAPAYTVKEAPIRHSFSAAMQSIGTDAGTTALLTRAFRGGLDLSRSLQPGDRVTAVFAQNADSAGSGERAGNGDNAGSAGSYGIDATREPLAVRIEHGSTVHDLFLHKGLDGKPFYYSKDGASTNPSFDRYPLNFSRISSAFSLHRLDPVLHRWQSHDGVDLAAPTGTPVHATAQGVIRFIGRQTGYGKVIKIQNPAPYSTTFAHLSRFAKGLRVGSRVKRDQVIGYVGETGWATGPHLHYELHVDDVPRDPLTVRLPRSTPLHADEMPRFKARVAQLTALL